MRKPNSVDVTVAQRMYDNGEGWGPVAITRLLNAQGVDVSRFTVARWVDPAKAERHRLQSRKAKRGERADACEFQFGRRVSPEYREAFMRRLRAAGVPPGSIAKVHGVVFGKEISRSVVERIVQGAA